MSRYWHLVSLESIQRDRVARGALTPLLCCPNFPRAQYLDIRTLTHELIVEQLFLKPEWAIESEAMKDVRNNCFSKIQLARRYSAARVLNPALFATSGL